MGPWSLPIAMLVLVLACVVMGLIGAEDRPGFRDGRTDVKDRWFFHTKKD